jgi:histidinol phosphatase-like enzyme
VNPGKAIFVDRDGVLCEMVYYQNHGIVDSPFTARQLRLVEGTAEPLNEFRILGYQLILVPNYCITSS